MIGKCLDTLLVARLNQRIDRLRTLGAFRPKRRQLLQRFHVDVKPARSWCRGCGRHFGRGCNHRVCFRRKLRRSAVSGLHHWRRTKGLRRALWNACAFVWRTARRGRSATKRGRRGKDAAIRFLHLSSVKIGAQLLGKRRACRRQGVDTRFRVGCV